MNTIAQPLDKLLPLLRCPACHSRLPLTLRAGEGKSNLQVAMHSEHIFCESCKAQYPITQDLIPLMWDKEVKEFYDQGDTLIDHANSTVAANIAIYENITDNYQLYTRNNANVAKRIQTAAKRILDRIFDSNMMKAESSDVFHLDFGCGPGNVLGWLRGFQATQIGLDVSIGNLRNARKNTGCLVVCGNAANMPFADGAIDLVTESSALHHINDWKSAIRESIRICNRPGGIIIDSEPSKELLAYGPLAVMLLNARFPVFKILSYFVRDKYIFRDMAEAKLNMKAEIHAQPGTGIPVDELQMLFSNANMTADVILSPTPDLICKPSPNWKRLLLDILSARNPWNYKYGSFILIAFS